MPDPTGTGAEERRWIQICECGTGRFMGLPGERLDDRGDCPFCERPIPEPVEYVPASDLAALQERLEEVERERIAIIHCINLYGDGTLHGALDDAGLLLDSEQSVEGR